MAYKRFGVFVLTLATWAGPASAYDRQSVINMAILAGRAQECGEAQASINEALADVVILANRDDPDLSIERMTEIASSHVTMVVRGEDYLLPGQALPTCPEIGSQFWIRFGIMETDLKQKVGNRD